MTTDPQSDRPADSSGNAALRHRDFLIFGLSKLLVFLGHHMVMVAIAYQVYDITGDAEAVAYVHLAILGPLVAFAIVTGYVSDRFDRRMVLVVGYTAMAFVVAALCMLSLSGGVATGWVYVLLVVMGTARAFYNPATNAIIPNLVPIEVFPNAVAWNTVVNKTGQIVGPMMGGFIYLLGPEVVYASSTVFFVLGAAGAAFIRPRAAVVGSRKTTLKELFAGALFIWRKRVVLGAILIDLTVVVTASVVGVLPIIAKDILVVGAAGAGVLRSAMAMGGLVAAFGMTRFPITAHAGRIMMLGSMMLAVFAIGVGLSTSFPLSVFLMAMMGASDMLSINVRHTMVQIATPDDMRGRVAAVSSISASGSNEIGGFRAAWVAGMVGPVASIVGGGLVGVGLVWLLWKTFPELSKVQRIDRKL